MLGVVMALYNPQHNVYYALIAGTLLLLILFASMNKNPASDEGKEESTKQGYSTKPPKDKSHKPSPFSDEEAFEALKRLGQKINEGGSNKCDFVMYGEGWGGHELCAVNPSSSCRFISFGISFDYSFDTDLAKKALCKGLALDPTVSHPAKLSENVWFMAIGATTLDPPPENWIVTSVPSIMKWAKYESIDVLKMDCEGCEYALARDVLEEDPNFFDRVGQFAVEFHMSRKWCNTLDRVINLGKLYLLLEKAGIELISVKLSPCHPDDEAPGCHSKLVELDYPCKPTKMCQNLLFARPVEELVA